MPTKTQGGSPRSKRAAAAEPAVRVLSLDEIEQSTHLAEKIVPVPEWGEGVGIKLRQLTKRQHTDVKVRASVRGVVDEDLATLHGIIESMVEPKLTHDQTGVVNDWPSSVVERIESAMLELNGLTAEALAAMEAAFRAAGIAV